MEENKAYINQAITQINNMTELLYQEQVQEALALMSGILDSIIRISEIVMPVAQIDEEDKKKVIESLGSAMNAMEQKDYVLLADVMHYDMIELLEKFREKF